MKANEFITEAGFLGKLGSGLAQAAGSFAKGTGLLKDEDYMKLVGNNVILKKMASEVLYNYSSGIKALLDKAKQRQMDLSKDPQKEQFDKAAKQILSNTVRNVLKIDPANQEYWDEIDEILGVTTNNPDQVTANNPHLQQAFSIMVGKTAKERPGTSPASKQGEKETVNAVYGKDKEGNTSLYIQTGNTWEKYMRTAFGDQFKKINLSTKEIAELNRQMNIGKIKPKSMDILRFNSKTIDMDTGETGGI